MNKRFAALLAALVLTLGTAYAEGVKIDGQIRAAQTHTILAPYSGIVDDFSVEEGDTLSAGTQLFTIRATPIYADFDGTVTAVFAKPGDSTAAVQGRYGALAYFEQTNLYTASCTTAGADSDNENKIIHVGETVYIRSTNNTNRRGIARVTGVEGRSYTLEVLEEKDMRLGENIKVYRDADYTSSQCIGSGRVSRVDPAPVTADGYVLSVCVEDGAQVKRGDLLFEIVQERPEGMDSGNGVVLAQDGVLLTVAAQSGTRVEKDALMATYCVDSELRLVCAVDEEDLAALSVGQQMEVTLDAYPDEPIAGTIVKMAGAGTAQGANASYEVSIELAENDKVRIGMNASAK